MGVVDRWLALAAAGVPVKTSLQILREERDACETDRLGGGEVVDNPATGEDCLLLESSEGLVGSERPSSDCISAGIGGSRLAVRSLW